MKASFIKHVALSIWIGTALIGCASEDDEIDSLPSSCDFIDFRYYNNTQENLGEMSKDYLVIGVENTYTDAQIQLFISSLTELDQSHQFTIHQSGRYQFKEIPVKLTNSKDCAQITQIINDLEQHQMIGYAHFAMKTSDCNNLLWEPMGNLCVNSYGSSFFVKVFDENDLTDLNQVISQTNTELVEQNQFMPKWFELRATKRSIGDGLAMANYFYETGLFEHSEPGLSKYPVE